MRQDIGMSKDFIFGKTLKAQENKTSKKNQIGVCQTKRLLHSKRSKEY